MSKGFSINDILGAGAKTAAPAGQKMQVVMLPAADIEPNPENSIYEIGDVSMLMADIAERGFNTRQSQLLKMFPDARTDDAGILVYCPDAFIAKEISAEYCNKYNKCQECRKDYWLAEVDT